jgi:hypothetical protein
MKQIICGSVLLLSLVTAGCDISKATSDALSSAAGPSQDAKDGAKDGAKDTKETAAAPKATKLDKVGLTADLPADATVMAGISATSNMVSTNATTLTIGVAKDTDPKTLEQGKGSAMLGDKGRNLKGDKTSDGWVVTWENTGMIGDTPSDNYWLSMRREIGGKGYMCETMQSNEDQRKAAIAICNSLKP